MSEWTLADSNGVIVEAGHVASTSSLTNIAPGNTANTKCAWVEFVASTSYPVSSLLLAIVLLDSTYAELLFDVGIGAAGSEVVLISNIQVSSGGIYYYAPNNQYLFHVQIPAGTRISVRAQSDSIYAEEQRVQLFLFSGGFDSLPTGQHHVTYGANEADSGGTESTNVSLNDYGDWVELTPATTFPIKRLFVLHGNRDTARGSSSACVFWKRIAIGAAGSEVVIIENMRFRASSATDLGQPGFYVFSVDIPAGTRLSVSSYGQNQLNDLLSDTTLIGES